jgi:hypothetical protein
LHVFLLFDQYTVLWGLDAEGGWFLGVPMNGELKQTTARATAGPSTSHLAKYARCFAQDDTSLGAVKGKQTAAKTKADPYGMTNKRTGNANDKANGKGKRNKNWFQKEKSGGLEASALLLGDWLLSAFALDGGGGGACFAAGTLGGDLAHFAA